MSALRRIAGSRSLVIAVGAVGVLLATAGGLTAASSWLISGGPGDAASAHLTGDGSPPQMTRLAPSTRPLSPGELAAFRKIVPDIAPDSVPIAHGRTKFEGETWSFTTWRNRANEVCSGTNVPGEGHGKTCLPAGEQFAERPVRLARGAREKDGGWHVVWIEGLVSPQVRSLVIVTSDCKQREIDVDSDGVFFHLISGADAVAGEWPLRIEAYDAAGEVFVTTRLPVTQPDAESPFAVDQPSCA